MKKLLTATLFFAAMALPLQALELDNMSDAERQIFRDEIRAYLLENPEVLVEAIGVLEQRQADNQVSGDQNLVAANAAALFDDANSYVGGNPEGDVVMVEFLDYKCGFCKRAHPEVTELLKTDGNIRYIIKEFPILGEQSLLASRFAISVLRNADASVYREVNDTLMTFRGEVTLDSLERLARTLDLNVDVIMAGMNDDAVAQIINANRALAQKMQISGTPSFVVGDQMLRGYLPLEGMRQVVAQLREGS